MENNPKRKSRWSIVYPSCLFVLYAILYAVAVAFGVFDERSVASAAICIVSFVGISVINLLTEASPAVHIINMLFWSAMVISFLGFAW